MPIVSIDMYEGRTVEQKRQLVKEITAAFVNVGTPAAAVHIVMRDMPRHNYGDAGILGSDKVK